MDIDRVAAVLRLLRLRRGLRQDDLAAAAGVPRKAVAAIERGAFGTVSIARLVDVGRALGAQVDIRIRWQGSDVDRLVNRDHGAMHEQVARLFTRLPGWSVQPEASFSIWGERGVIDLLAFHAAASQAVVIELKTTIVDVQELLGTLDRKRRLARVVARDRGWPAARVSAWVIVADTPTNRRRLADHRTVLRAALPVDGRRVRTWLRSPEDEIGALSFLSIVPVGPGITPLAARRRVRRRGRSVNRAGELTSSAPARPRSGDTVPGRGS